MRYFVTAYEPGRRIEFQFTEPSGFNGHHSFTATSLTDNSTLLRHELFMSPSGSRRKPIQLFIRRCKPPVAVDEDPQSTIRCTHDPQGKLPVKVVHTDAPGLCSQLLKMTGFQRRPRTSIREVREHPEKHPRM